EDKQGLQPGALGDGEDCRAQKKTDTDDRRHGEERRGNGDARAEQHDEEEDAADTGRKRLDTGMQVDAIDRVIAEKSHGENRRKEMRKRPANCRSTARQPLGNLSHRGAPSSEAANMPPAGRPCKPSTRLRSSAPRGRTNVLPRGF